MVVRAGHCEGCTKRVHSVTRVPVHRVPRFLGDPTAASVRPTGILTCVGSVLRQWRLLLSSASPPSLPPCPPPSRLCLSSPSPSTLPPISFSLFLRLPRSLSRSSHPFALSLLLPSLPRCHGFRSAATSAVTPPLLPPLSLSSFSRPCCFVLLYYYGPLLLRLLRLHLRLFHLLPPGLPHLRSRPARFPTT